MMNKWFLTLLLMNVPDARAAIDTGTGHWKLQALCALIAFFGVLLIRNFRVVKPTLGIKPKDSVQDRPD